MVAWWSSLCCPLHIDFGLPVGTDSLIVCTYFPRGVSHSLLDTLLLPTAHPLHRDNRSPPGLQEASIPRLLHCRHMQWWPAAAHQPCRCSRESITAHLWLKTSSGQQISQPPCHPVGSNTYFSIQDHGYINWSEFPEVFAKQWIHKQTLCQDLVVSPQVHAEGFLVICFPKWRFFFFLPVFNHNCQLWTSPKEYPTNEPNINYTS